MLIFAIFNYTGTKSSLISHGASSATASLISWAVMLIASGLPTLAIFRILNMRGRPYDYVAAMILPLISWGIAQFPANFDQTGAALKYCSPRPDNTLFCWTTPRYRSITQTKLVPMSSDVAAVEFRRDKGLVPRPITRPLTDVVFFDSLTGQPKVWVHENDDGCFDMYDNSGMDPQSGGAAIPSYKKGRSRDRGISKRSRHISNDNGAANLTEPIQAQQKGAAVGHTDCKVLPILNMSAMTIDTPYIGGCSHGLARRTRKFCI